MNPRLRNQLLLIAVSVVAMCSVGLLIVNAHRQGDAISVLYSPERLFADAPEMENIFGANQGGFTLFAVDAAQSNARSYNAESRISQTAKLRQPDLESLAASKLKNGNTIVSASPNEDALVSMLNATRQTVKKFGKKKEYGIGDRTQNLFFNQGKIAVNQSDGAIYFVPTHALRPVVQKFSGEGELLSEFAVEGEAVNLQSGLTKKLLDNKKDFSCAEGYTVVRSATVDQTTGHLWLGLNGSAKSGVVYEYSPGGEKLREYAFFLPDDSGAYRAITGVKAIVVRAPSVFILSDEGAVYRYNLNDNLGASINASNRAKERAERGRMSYPNQMVSYLNSFWSPSLSPWMLLQSPCPAEQPLSCSVNCRANSTPASINCGTRAKSTLPMGAVITGQTACNNTGTVTGQTCRPTCVVSYNVCRDNGDTYTTTYTSACNAPPEICGNGVDENCNGQTDENCTVSGVWCDPECFETGDPDCPCNGMWGRNNKKTKGKAASFIKAGLSASALPRCYCSSSPIIIDILGNGYSMTDSQNGVSFDFNADGVARGRLSWTAAGSDDAWLVLDRNGNGQIDNGKELFGNATAQPAPPTGEERHGFLALAEFDKAENSGNGDGMINKNDSIFALLRLWQDVNHNGISEPEELHTLSSLEVVSIELDYKESKRTDEHGNAFRYRAKVTDAKGVKVNRWAWDVFLISAP